MLIKALKVKLWNDYRTRPLACFLTSGTSVAGRIISSIRAPDARRVGRIAAEAFGIDLDISPEVCLHDHYLLHLDAWQWSTDVEFRISAVARDEAARPLDTYNSASPPRSAPFFRLFLSRGRAPVLHVFFPISGYARAMPEDMEEHETLNTVTEGILSIALRNLPDERRAVIDAFRDRWARERDRLLDLMADTAPLDMRDAQQEPPENMACKGYLSNPLIVLAYPATRLGDAKWWFMAYRGVEGSYMTGMIPEKDFIARNPEEVATLPDLTDHQKATLTRKMSDEDTYRATRAIFDAARRKRMLAVPTRNSDITVRCWYAALSRLGDGNHYFSANFSDGRVMTMLNYVRQTHFDRHHPVLGKNRTIDIENEDASGAIKAAFRPDGYVRVDTRDGEPVGDIETIRSLIEAFLAVDVPIPARSMPPLDALPDPSHPLINGFDVPPRHAGLVSGLCKWADEFQKRS